MSGGTITGGTGVYAGASGSLDLTFVKDYPGASWSTTTVTGSGSVIVASNTIPLTLTNFRGWCCSWRSTRERDYALYPVSVSGSLGSPAGQVKLYNYPSPPLAVDGLVTLTFNSTDSLMMGYGFTPTGTSIAPPSSFTGNIAGGTGKYANAYGALTYTNGSDRGLNVKGTMTLPSSGATITQVRTVYGWSWMAGNTWLEIHGKNLVPANTPSAGVDWSNAPEFANGQMPTQLGPVSVTFGGGGSAGFIYFYCSAQTNPNCADDQINVLSPMIGLRDPSQMRLAVNNNGIPIAVTAPLRDGYSPAFLSFDASGHIAARHLDASLVGPTSLYPGLSTPAKVGETISLYGVGFNVGESTVVLGSATQSGTFTIQDGYCWVSGISAQAAGALVSPGLFQINLTIPKGVPSGDNPVMCIENFYPTFPGSIIAVQ